MLVLVIVIILALAIHSLVSETDQSSLSFSRYTKDLNTWTLRAIFEAMKRIESEQDEDIQYLLNAGIITKQTIEDRADNILFERGEFPAEQLTIDPRDFDKMIKMYEIKFRGASAEHIQYMINIIMK